jgi:hypothetical protein
MVKITFVRLYYAHFICSIIQLNSFYRYYKLQLLNKYSLSNPFHVSSTCITEAPNSKCKYILYVHIDIESLLSFSLSFQSESFKYLLLFHFINWPQRTITPIMSIKRNRVSKLSEKMH